MLDGRGMVFVSCSELYKTRTAYAFRDAIEGAGLRAIIASDEPKLGGDFTPEDKVDQYLELADAVVVIATPDDELADGTRQPRPNVVDEIGRARHVTHLRGKIAIVKAQGVTLHSNIDPVYEALDPDAPDEAIRRVLGQLARWGVLAMTAPERTDSGRLPVQEPADRSVLEGLPPDDRWPAIARARERLRALPKAHQRHWVDQIVDMIFDATTPSEFLPGAGFLLEGILTYDPDLMPNAMLDRLSRHPRFEIRASVGVMLHDLAIEYPGRVPLDLAENLAASGDWYVQQPAQNALKELAFTRPQALEFFIELVPSPDVNDRGLAVGALRDLAQRGVGLPEVGRALNELKLDENDYIRRAAEEGLAAHAEFTGRPPGWGRFGAY